MPKRCAGENCQKWEFKDGLCTACFKTKREADEAARGPSWQCFNLVGLPKSAQNPDAPPQEDCLAWNKPESKVCMGCGKKKDGWLEKEEVSTKPKKFCHNCGKADPTKFCGGCGAKQEMEEVPAG